LADLETARSRTDKEPVRQLLDLVRFAIYDRLAESPAVELASRVASEPPRGPFAAVPPYRIWTTALRRLQEQGETTRVLLVLDAALAQCPDDVLADILLLKGETLYKAAGSRRGLLEAGSAFMRVPIHFPQDPRAARGLLWAARVHEELSAPRKAMALLRECLAHPLVDSDTRAAAAEALQRLTEVEGS
jgi:hypothetical protein